MKDTALAGTIFELVFLLAACGRSETIRPTQTQQIAEPSTPTAEPPATLVPATPVLPAATEATGIPVTGMAIVQVRNVGDFGPALVDGEGRSLYLFTGGVQYHSPSPCTGEECLEEWLPLLVKGDPVAGEGVDDGKLGVIPREDGTTQVTYNGWRLYYLNQDKEPGDAVGQGDDHEWYLVAPSGEPIRSTERE